MSLTNRLRCKEESIVLSIWVVHFESSKERSNTLTSSSLKLASQNVWLMSAFQYSLYNLLGGRPCADLLKLALSLAKLARKGELMKDLYSGTHMCTWVRNAKRKFRKSYSLKFSVIMHLLSCLRWLVQMCGQGFMNSNGCAVILIKFFEAKKGSIVWHITSNFTAVGDVT